MNKKTIIKVLVVCVAVAAMVSGLMFTSWVDDYYGGPVTLENDGNIINAESYNEIYRVLTTSIQEENKSIWDDIFGGYNYSDAEDYDEIDDESQDFYDTDYSVTNIQTQGVDEGDIVKSDGTYLYVSDEYSKVYIYDMNSTSEILVSSITIEDMYGYLSDMYVTEDNLIIICDNYDYYGETIIYSYDISEINAPKLISEIHQSGSYSNSRLVENILYTFSSYIMYDFTREDCVPYAGEEKIKAEDIYYSGEIKSPEYSVITSVDITKSDEFINSKAILGSVEDTYVSNENIYFASLDEDTNTEIIKLSYNEGIIEGIALCSVEGSVKDSFAMDEFENNLRVATTLDEAGNSMYVLDENLKQIGSIKGLAVGERIYSSRYLGDIAYFVTYENIDPLFAIDLSDPTNPTVVNELKVTGFSEYLHFWSTNLLIGIGEETNPETGETLGVKLSMYDISNPSNITEVNKLVLDKYAYTSAENNHKAIMIDPEKNLIGLSLESSYDSETYYVDYLLLSYNEETGFETKIMDKIYDEETGNEEYSYLGYDLTQGSRGVYMGDDFYVVSHDYRISKYSLNTYRSIKVYNLFEKDTNLPEV